VAAREEQGQPQNHEKRRTRPRQEHYYEHADKHSDIQHDALPELRHAAISRIAKIVREYVDGRGYRQEGRKAGSQHKSKARRVPPLAVFRCGRNDGP
jgi:hypothetical protein